MNVLKLVSEWPFGTQSPTKINVMVDLTFLSVDEPENQ